MLKRTKRILPKSPHLLLLTPAPVEWLLANGIHSTRETEAVLDGVSETRSLVTRAEFIRHTRESRHRRRSAGCATLKGRKSLSEDIQVRVLQNGANGPRTRISNASFF